MYLYIVQFYIYNLNINYIVYTDIIKEQCIHYVTYDISSVYNITECFTAVFYIFGHETC